MIFKTKLPDLDKFEDVVIGLHTRHEFGPARHLRIEAPSGDAAERR